MLDEQLFLKGINQKKNGMWEELYRYFYGSLCNYAAGIIGTKLEDKSIVEDIVQESLIRIWNASVEFTDFKALSVYLYRSVGNNTIKYLRDLNVDNRRLDHWQKEQKHSALEEDEMDSILYPAVEEEVVRRLRCTIDKLPEQSRRIVVKSLAGCTIRQIADLLEISPNTVKTQKQRAYRFIREHWGDLFLLFFIYFINILTFLSPS